MDQSEIDYVNKNDEKEKLSRTANPEQVAFMKEVIGFLQLK